MSRTEQYLANIGNKFEQDGSVRFFPGNTVISFINQKAPIFKLFCDVRKMLQESIAGDCFAYMPDDSIHMTVFEGVCDQWRDESVWTKLLPTDVQLTEVDKLFERLFVQSPRLGEVHMRAIGIKADGGYGISLLPCTQSDEQKLHTYRDQMSELFGIRFPNHDAYAYHISICYGIKAPTEEQEQELDRFEGKAAGYIAAKGVEFTVEQPDMTYFRSMYAFEKERFER